MALILILLCNSATSAFRLPVHRQASPTRSKPLRVVSIASGGGGDPRGAAALLAVTITLEVVATTCMKMTIQNRFWYVGVGLGYGLCFAIFPLVLRRMPLATAYAIWSGAGTVATALVSAAFFGESLTFRKCACIGLIVAGVVGLNLIGGGSH